MSAAKPCCSAIRRTPIVPFLRSGNELRRLKIAACLMRLIEKHGADDWEKVFTEYADLRKENRTPTRSADLAGEKLLRNARRRRRPGFRAKNANSKRNSNTHFPTISPNTRMVTFREDLPYSAAKETRQRAGQIADGNLREN